MPLTTSPSQQLPSTFAGKFCTTELRYQDFYLVSLHAVGMLYTRHSRAALPAVAVSPVPAQGTPVRLPCVVHVSEPGTGVSECWLLDYSTAEQVEAS